MTQRTQIGPLINAHNGQDKMQFRLLLNSTEVEGTQHGTLNATE